MVGRSLSTSPKGIAQAKRALLRKSLTQKAIANELAIASRSTVSKFFNGHPVDRTLFMEICHVLDLDWAEVVDTPELTDECTIASNDADPNVSQIGQDKVAIIAVTSEGSHTPTAVHPDFQDAVAQALQRSSFQTLNELAASLDIPISTVSHYFQGSKISIDRFRNISEGLSLEIREYVHDQTDTQAHAPTSQHWAVGQFYAYDQAWVGRETLIPKLMEHVCGSCRLLLITGMAGIGKTALAERLSLDLPHIPTTLRENFDIQDQASDFGTFAGRLLEKMGQVVTSSDRSDIQHLLQRLLQALRAEKYLILIDSLEEILQGNEEEGWNEFEDETFSTFFQQVLASETLQSRFIITSQDLPTQLLAFGTRYQNFWVNHPLTGLTEAEQLALFEKTGLDVSPNAEGHPYLVRIGRAYEGHPLALRIITGEMGNAPFYGDIMAYWNRYGTEIEIVEEAIASATDGQMMGADDKWQLDRFTRTLRRNVRRRLEQTFKRLHQDIKFAYILLCEASVYRCAVPEDWWLSHLEYWDCDKDVGAMALDALKDRFLVEEVVDAREHAVRQHNLIRSVSLEHLHRLDEDA